MGQYQMQSAGQQVQLQGLQIEGLGYENALKRINKIAEEAKNKLIDRWTQMADQGSVFANFMLWQYSLDALSGINAKDALNFGTQTAGNIKSVLGLVPSL